MLRIRLRHVGANKQPSYRIVVAEKTAPRDGRFLEAIGFYNPRTEPATVHYKEDRALHWLSVGAQPSEAVARLFRNGGTMDRLERLKAGEPLEVLLAEAEAEVEVGAVAAGEAQEITPEVSESAEAAAEEIEAAEEAEAAEEVDAAEAESAEPDEVEVAEEESESETEPEEAAESDEDAAPEEEEV